MDDQQKTPQQPGQDPNAPQPAAYDTQGRPLYHMPPPTGQSPTPPQVVHLSRAIEPIEQVVSPGVLARHKQSAHDFPQLNLSEGEFVINMVQRHPIGLLAPVGISIFVIAFIASVMVNFDMIMNSLFGPNAFYLPEMGPVYMVGGLLILLISLLCYVSVWVYLNNTFFLTNESVIQEIQVSLFSKHEQTVSLQNIEDASYRQQGLLQTMFNYGSIRLSTEGDETTYRFNYVADPKRQIAILNDAVEAFKNGRPVIND